VGRTGSNDNINFFLLNDFLCCFDGIPVPAFTGIRNKEIAPDETEHLLKKSNRAFIGKPTKRDLLFPR
jgi:hypothetical protein